MSGARRAGADLAWLNANSTRPSTALSIPPIASITRMLEPSVRGSGCWQRPAQSRGRCQEPVNAILQCACSVVRPGRGPKPLDVEHAGRQQVTYGDHPVNLLPGVRPAASAGRRCASASLGLRAPGDLEQLLAFKQTHAAHKGPPRAAAANRWAEVHPAELVFQRCDGG